MNTDKFVKEKQQIDYKEGTSRQDIFIRLMKKNEYYCQKASNFQDVNEHWDVLTGKNKIYERIDVKGLKAGMSKGYACMELQTISGKKGWLISEYSDTIAFESEDCFLFVDREKLAAIVNEKIAEIDAIEGKKIYMDWDIKFNDLGFYRRYKRISYEHDDEVVKSPLIDFEHLINRKLYKSDGRLEMIKKNIYYD